VNIIQPGNNYGWPVIGYGVNYRSGAAIHTGTHRDGMQQPLHIWVPSIGISGLLIYTGDKFPGWQGNLFAGGMSGKRLVRMTLNGQKVDFEEDLLWGVGRVRDVRQGPDGLIYLAIDGERGAATPILRLEPAGN
jgi:glucose/arabinose dehydrogenase